MCVAPVENWGKRIEIFYETVDVDFFFSFLVAKYVSYLIFQTISIVRSDQGGSRNLFSVIDYENKYFNVTLVLDDNQYFRAHKGSTHSKHYVQRIIRVHATHDEEWVPRKVQDGHTF